MQGWGLPRRFSFYFGACSCAPRGAEFVIWAKLCLASLLSAYAAGGYFLAAARK
ncbi:MAG: hypothetical protein LBO63_07315 [Oscillospiraceae bacterium]|nr:hypothetical protein [Oscillospiraceae bacterium]